MGAVLLALVKKQSPSTVEAESVVQRVEERIAAVGKNKRLIAALADAKSPGRVTEEMKRYFERVPHPLLVFPNLAAHTAMVGSCHSLAARCPRSLFADLSGRKSSSVGLV